MITLFHGSNVDVPKPLVKNQEIVDKYLSFTSSEIVETED